MNASKVTATLAISLPVTLLLLLVVIVGVEPGVSCAASATPSSESAGSSDAPVGLSERQLQLARQGVAVGKQLRQPKSVIVAELAAMITESTLRNLANPAVPESLRYANDGLGYDHDSVGPHQMRASVWGAAGIAALMTPTYQITWFYSQAVKVAGAQVMSPAALAQAVELSAPNAYAGALDLAERLYAMFADVDVDPAPTDTQLPVGCGATGSGAPLPEASEFGAAVIRAAERWIGTDYVWGGGDFTGPTNGGFDCSGLTQYAVYQASGGRIRLPRTTGTQQNDPAAQVVPFEQRQPGDLIFFTAPGESTPHHVGIYYGRNNSGTDLILHAPQSGQTVTVAPLWGGEHLEVRRYTPPATTRNPNTEERNSL
ncbi:C40 family peptidase [Nocardia sp. NPDC003482]